MTDDILHPRVEVLREHYRDFLPKAYKELEEAGRLEHVLEELARNMEHDEMAAVQNGYRPDEAREITNDTWLPRPEPETDDEPLPIASFRELLKEVIDLQQKVSEASSSRDTSPEGDDEADDAQPGGSSPAR